MDQGLIDMHNKVQDMDRQNMKLYEKNCEIKERVVQQQSRSMRDNLICKGIPDEYLYSALYNNYSKRFTL
jgi:hypothetical protein